MEDFQPAAFSSKVVGTRTGNGVRGLTSPPDLMDGGFQLVPKDVLYSLDSKWIIGRWRRADVEVAGVPSESRHGRDQQLETRWKC